MSRRSFGTIRKLPSGRYQARYSDASGKQISAGTTFATKAAAHRWLATVEADLVRGTLADPAGARLRFADWADERLRTKPGQRAATLARDRAALDTWFTPALHDMPLVAITPSHIRSVVAAMQTKNLAPKSVRTYVGTLQAIFRAAVDADLLAKSPVRPRLLGLETIPRRERPTLTAEQLLELAGAVPERYRALVLLAGTVGLRWGEAVGLRVGDIDFLRRRISIEQTVEEVAGQVRVVPTTKSDASRRSFTLPTFLVGEFAQHLAQHRPGVGPESLVFIGPRGGLLRRSFEGRAFRPAALSAGLSESLTFHGLRHVATSLMVANNERPKVIQHRLGHADPAVSLGVYAHVADDVDRAAADRLNRLFESVQRSSAGEL